MEAVTVPRATARPERPWWRETLAPYAKPSIGRSLLDLATSVVPYLALFALDVPRRSTSPTWLVLAISRARPPASCCAPTSSSTTARTARSCPPSAATRGSASVLGLLVYSPFARWRHDHAVHHATAGDLDRRGTGDVPT